jgi:hypothetical protein
MYQNIIRKNPKTFIRHLEKQCLKFKGNNIVNENDVYQTKEGKIAY